MFRLGLRRFATACDAARPYGIKVAKAQGTVNGFVGGVCVPKILNNLLVLTNNIAIGNTPLIRLNRLSEETGCDIYGKAEFMNPGGSVKGAALLSQAG